MILIIALQLKVQRSEDQTADHDAGERSQKLNSVPHIVNLNEDSQLSGVILHFLDKGEVMMVVMVMVIVRLFWK